MEMILCADRKAFWVDKNREMVFACVGKGWRRRRTRRIMCFPGHGRGFFFSSSFLV